MIAKQKARCDYAGCKHPNGMILPGQEITWNRKVAGSRYHVDCFVAWKGLDEYNPASRTVTPSEPTTIDLELEDFKPVKAPVAEVKPLRHFQYWILAHYVATRQHTYLWGSPGAGKSHVARQIAGELGLEFSFISVNPQSPASLLMGYMAHDGVTYHQSELYKRWKDGGVFLFDELDNCSSSLLTTLNGMLASDVANFPCGMVPKHPDFVFIGTGNTTGRGGDWQFPERRKIDEASLDRLVFIKWEYDTVLETSFVASIPNGPKWAKWVQTVREYCANKANGIKGGVYASPRAIISGAKDLAMVGNQYFSIEGVAERHVFKGLDKDTVARIVANCPLPRL